MDDIYFAVNFIVKIFLYISVIILFFKQKGVTRKAKFITVIALAHVVLLHPALQDDVIINSLILAILLAFNIPLWISKETAIVLLLITVFLPTKQYFWLFLLAQVFYFVTIGGLILAALEPEKPQPETPKEAEKPKKEVN